LEDSRNKTRVKADWQFTTADARVKLNRLSMPARIRRNMPSRIILAWYLPSRTSPSNALWQTGWATNIVKPLPPQAVANGQAL
jgi:hypothetical protein